MSWLSKARREVKRAVKDVFDEGDRFLDRRIGIDDPAIRQLAIDPFSLSGFHADERQGVKGGVAASPDPLPTEIDLVTASDEFRRRLARRSRNRPRQTAGIYGEFSGGPTLSLL